MNYMTTTELRTKTKELIQALKDGETVELIHRSKIIGEFRPAEEEAPVIRDLEKFEKFLAGIDPGEDTTYRERERRYRKHLEGKYGKGLSGHQHIYRLR
ncbi:MAG: hypothetical protein HYU80_04635 [Candidatus Blackburnbacteria bacterium]|nr:hypothetical protein [Candidatus Blackburnbacteria bacterium]